MTEEEIARARAEYDALPGKPSDHCRFRSNAEIIESGEPMTVQLRDIALTMEGAFHRWTYTDAGVWVESWDAAPRKQADFDEGALRERLGK